jgi:MerR family mercuric resistance operon transcriptional regulator
MLSHRTGCKIETIRYYERIGLLPTPPRTSGGHRTYTLEHERRLGFVRRSRELGFSLDDIRHLLGLADGDALECGKVQKVALDHLLDVRRKIRDLKKLERTLTRISDRCEGGTAPDCPIIEALYMAKDRV